MLMLNIIIGNEFMEHLLMTNTQIDHNFNCLTNIYRYRKIPLTKSYKLIIITKQESNKPMMRALVQSYHSISHAICLRIVSRIHIKTWIWNFFFWLSTPKALTYIKMNNNHKCK